MIQGVLFDMDGVLFNTEAMSIRIGRGVIDELGLPYPEGLSARLCGANHATVKREMELAMGPGFDYESYRARTSALMHDELERGGVPKMPGLDELLAYLQQHGYRMAVASSTSIANVRHHLQAAGILHFFTAVIGGDMVPASKPAPDIFLRAAGELGLAPAHCAAIEDSYNGVRSAAAAGCLTLMVPDQLPPTPEISALCAAVLPSLAAVPAFLEKTNKNTP